MIYEWKCKKCGKRVDVTRDIEHHAVPPEWVLDGVSGTHDWVRVFSASIPFQTLRDKGVFMDEHGNYPPRKMPWQ